MSYPQNPPEGTHDERSEFARQMSGHTYTLIYEQQSPSMSGPGRMEQSHGWELVERRDMTSFNQDETTITLRRVTSRRRGRGPFFDEATQYEREKRANANAVAHGVVDPGGCERRSDPGPLGGRTTERWIADALWWAPDWFGEMQTHDGPSGYETDLFDVDRHHTTRRYGAGDHTSRYEDR